MTTKNAPNNMAMTQNGIQFFIGMAQVIDAMDFEKKDKSMFFQVSIAYFGGILKMTPADASEYNKIKSYLGKAVKVSGFQFIVPKGDGVKIDWHVQNVELLG